MIDSLGVTVVTLGCGRSGRAAVMLLRHAASGSSDTQEDQDSTIQSQTVLSVSC